MSTEVPVKSNDQKPVKKKTTKTTTTTTAAKTTKTTAAKTTATTAQPTTTTAAVKRAPPVQLMECRVCDMKQYTKYHPQSKENKQPENMIQLFGIDEKRQTYSIHVTGFKPFFYVKIPDKTQWSDSQVNNFVVHLRMKLSQSDPQPITRNQVLLNKKLYGFDNRKMHRFLLLEFRNMNAFQRAKSFWYTDAEPGQRRSLKKGGYVFAGARLELYEANVLPLLRFFHLTEMSPSGWIQLRGFEAMENLLEQENEEREEKGLESSNSILEAMDNQCKFTVVCDQADIVPLNERETPVPFLIMSFDIEASSSHGDFPLPSKTYKKLAMEIMEYFDKDGVPASDRETNWALAVCVANAFGKAGQVWPGNGNIIPAIPCISPVYTKVSTAKITVPKKTATRGRASGSSSNGKAVTATAETAKESETETWTLDVTVLEQLGVLCEEWQRMNVHTFNLSSDFCETKDLEDAFSAMRIEMDKKREVLMNVADAASSAIATVTEEGDVVGENINLGVESGGRDVLSDDDDFDDIHLNSDGEYDGDEESDLAGGGRSHFCVEDAADGDDGEAVVAQSEKKFRARSQRKGRRAKMMAGLIRDYTERRRKFGEGDQNKFCAIAATVRSSKLTREEKVNYLNATLGHIFPPVEGDKTTFIGSTFMHYGSKSPHLNHCLVLNTCESLPDTLTTEGTTVKTIIETCATEQELLLAWRDLVRKSNPDVVIGYNIFMFDYNFLFTRAQELGCEKEFLQIGKNGNEVCGNFHKLSGKWKIQETNVSLAGNQFEMKYIVMPGRVQVDLYAYYRRSIPLTSYKLDYVAGHLINEEVVRLACDEDRGVTTVTSTNLTGLLPGSFIHIQEIGHTVDYYEDGAKFEVLEIDVQSKTFVVRGLLNPSKEVKSVHWCLAKDDVTPKDIFRLTNGSDADRAKIAKYCIQDCNLVQYLFHKSDVLTGFIEMSRICRVPMNFLMTRGQGIKLQSMIAYECRKMDTLIPVLDTSESNDGYEGAIVLPPKCNLYLDDPIATNDYASLYPSSMCSENLSHDSKVWTKYILFNHMEEFAKCFENRRRKEQMQKDVKKWQERQLLLPESSRHEHFKDMACIEPGINNETKKKQMVVLKSLWDPPKEDDELELLYTPDQDAKFVRNGVKDMSDLVPYGYPIHRSKLEDGFVPGQPRTADNWLEFSEYKIMPYVMVLSRSEGERNADGTYVYDNLPGMEYVDQEYDLYEYTHTLAANGRKKAAKKTKIGVKICRFVQYPDGESAIIPTVLKKLLAARAATRKQQKDTKDAFMYSVLEQRQLAIKCSANSIYGACGAATSAFYEKDIAACTTAMGRKMLTYGKRIIEECFGGGVVCDTKSAYGQVKTYAEYIYGDTDSVFYRFNLTTLDGTPIKGTDALHITMELGNAVAEVAGKFLKSPHDFELEKSFMPLCLLSKKRYVGIMYEVNKVDKPKRKEMGIVLKRRDNAPIVKDVYGGIIDILMKEKNVHRAMEFLKSMLDKMLNKSIGMNKLVITKSLRSDYKNPQQIAHKVLADRIAERDPGNKLSGGDRISYVFVVRPNATSKKMKQGEKIETPAFFEESQHSADKSKVLKLDYTHYITNQIMKPVQQVFGLVIENVLQNLPCKTSYERLEAKLDEHRRNYALVIAGGKSANLDPIEVEKKLMGIEKKMEAERMNAVQQFLFDDALREANNQTLGQQSIAHFLVKKPPGDLHRAATTTVGVVRTAAEWKKRMDEKRAIDREVQRKATARLLKDMDRDDVNRGLRVASMSANGGAALEVADGKTPRKPKKEQSESAKKAASKATKSKATKSTATKSTATTGTETDSFASAATTSASESSSEATIGKSGASHKRKVRNSDSVPGGAKKRATVKGAATVDANAVAAEPGV